MSYYDKQVQLTLHKFPRRSQIRNWFGITQCGASSNSSNGEQSSAGEACWAHNPGVHGEPSSPNCQCFQPGRLHIVSLLSMQAHIGKCSNKHTPYAANCSTEMSRPFAAVVDTIVTLQAGDAICAVAGCDYMVFIAKYLTDL